MSSLARTDGLAREDMWFPDRECVIRSSVWLAPGDL
jgi:hypothetical protein